ncbi:MAG TPA: 4-(cytidine 5'-diphospho)-2-C-methyl-D-erythritol kinase [Bacteroidales bacterium]|jgi:4-diphosphocytidyl-2-C-methyl-D-erythritol kinase|nr:4-(cytidine 5'-diphospho)-2-C-methyl-D-erythritol kinase [Bacteroidales bacterium]OQB60706.1 MAG: 4-diphosphocytidyl-2-C-methyl-D-erythritol kinase [Bacteroidetes bacterium ADurb.Bin145]NMD02224.1 4-(cytidine 5'-diphospho)-2-C-methyl-D-erythritol kinase [Bacteroidales bacterium]HOU01407.1 4-(cytidine 5'-diphospho)-2-C-methyl-D-erythritol kinase [Bacteroidales bacterium]HQG62090.1 4-(cytidine 5'-diphospho)-2-C-methyl-D-erythritol kinase [Bacteroidales bacterium]
MIAFPKAKINLGLKVIRKRPDGFHDIETVFYPVDFCDALEFVVQPEKIHEDALVVTGHDIHIKPEKNLVIRAIKKLKQHYTLPYFRIHLHKAIPSGAGLGGGSSDAAYILKTINRHFNLSIDNDILISMALELGSDCPFFINAVPSIATGRGEILQPLEPFLSGFWLVLVNPRIRISTREAYLNTRPSDTSSNPGTIVSQDITRWKKSLVNDFEDFAFRLYPQLEEYKKSLYKAGALYSSMSGSGSTIYGIFEGKPDIPHDIRDFVIYEGIL